MGKVYFASIRLAFALVCVGASLILGGHWLGLVPDSAPLEIRARQSLSESIAINAAAHVRKQQWVDLETAIQTQTDRDEDLLSVGVRSDSGSLHAETSHHAEIWHQAQTDDPSVDAVEVPITLNRRPWGNVELCFQRPNPTLAATVMTHPLIRLLAFFALAGIPVYTIFVTRVIRLFHSTQVVPDRVRQALDTLAEGLLVLDEEERIVLANQSFAKTLKVAPTELVDQPASNLSWVSPDEDQNYPWSLAIGEAATQTEQMLRLEMSDGESRIFSVNAAPLGGDGSPRGALATFRDVTHIEKHRAELETMLSMLRSSRDEIERKNSELEILATQDALTGCLNRREFFKRFEKLWDQAQQQQMPLACIMIDNDHFKSVNDNYGHHIGDEVLRRVSRVIKSRHHEHGVVCRYGGEEFCVVLPGLTVQQAEREAELTRIAISEIQLEEPSELRLTASLGISELAFGAPSVQDLINQADSCLYAAKRMGRNCVVTYDPAAPLDMEEDSNRESNTRGKERIDIPYQAVTALVSALSYRDTKTAEHSRRVADVAVRAAKGLFDKRDTYLLEIAALLHDIGKVGVPDHILLKPGKLTEEEWEIMSRHERVGVEIVAGAFNCPQLTEIISSRQAHFDGRSRRHPHLPAGTEIPAHSRLLAIADSYDSMVSKSVYRKARTHEEAIEELKRCAGTQFDPEMVEQFAEKIDAEQTAAIEATNSIRSQAAIHLGFQVERIAEAIEAQDTEGMMTLAERLGQFARNSDLDSIAQAAESLRQQAASESVQWINLLRDTHQLLDLCRATQSDLLRENLEQDYQNQQNGDARVEQPSPVVSASGQA